MTVAELVEYLKALPQEFTVGVMITTFRDPGFFDGGIANPPKVENGLVVIPAERIE